MVNIDAWVYVLVDHARLYLANRMSRRDLEEWVLGRLSSFTQSEIPECRRLVDWIDGGAVEVAEGVITEEEFDRGLRQRLLELGPLYTQKPVIQGTGTVVFDAQNVTQSLS